MNWKRLLNPEQQEVMGLDIGSSAVKAVQLHKSNTGWVVTAAAVVDITKEGESGSSDKEMDIVGAVRNCLQSSGIQTRLAVCSICGPEVAVRCFKFPALPLEEIEGAILLEAEQVCPFNIDDSIVDYQLIPNGEDTVSGVLVAATNKLVRRKSDLVKQASLSEVLMDVDGLALLNCLSEHESLETGPTMAVLNIGSSYTNLAIVSDNNLPFIRDMSYGGDDIINSVATKNGLSTEIVSGILAGREDPSQDQLELADSLKEACRRLIIDVTDTLRYYTAEEKSVEKLFVCGGFALVKGFVELLDSQLPTTAVLWNPFEKMACEAGRECEDMLCQNGPAMAVAAGLAMRSV